MLCSSRNFPSFKEHVLLFSAERCSRPWLSLPEKQQIRLERCSTVWDALRQWFQRMCVSKPLSYHADWTLNGLTSFTLPEGKNTTHCFLSESFKTQYKCISDILYFFIHLFIFFISMHAHTDLRTGCSPVSADLKTGCFPRLSWSQNRLFPRLCRSQDRLFPSFSWSQNRLLHQTLLISEQTVAPVTADLRMICSCSLHWSQNRLLPQFPLTPEQSVQPVSADLRRVCSTSLSWSHNRLFPQSQLISLSQLSLSNVT